MIVNTTVTLSDVTDFNWDELIILGSYSNIEEIEKEFNLNLTNIKQNGINYSDYYDLVIFLGNNESVEIVELHHGIYSHREIIEKERCKFKKNQDGTMTLFE